jgi:hypothetical protein
VDSRAARAGRADANLAAPVFRHTCHQVGIEFLLRAPAGRLLHAGGALDFHRALIGLPAQGTVRGGGGDGIHACSIHFTVLEWLKALD